MNKLSLYLTATIIIVFSEVCFAQAPHEIAGFVLGKNIEEFKDRLNMSTELPVRYRESLREVVIKPMEGFKSGLITYGTCVDSGQIIRIKLKYAEFSKKFYETLLKRFEKKFGKPNEWQGDPFHILLKWKWSFTDENGNRISLHLQHNTRDAEEKIGNAVKLTSRTALEAEWKCYEEKTASKSAGKKKKTKQKNPVDWELFMPR
jgi:hypothetical protein